MTIRTFFGVFIALSALLFYAGGAKAETREMLNESYDPTR